MRKQQEHWLTYEDLSKRDLIQEFSNRLRLKKCFIEELIRLCDTDFRFKDDSNLPEYKKISRHIKIFWKVSLSQRQIRYIYRSLQNQERLKMNLKRGGKIRGTFRELIFRNS